MIRRPMIAALLFAIHGVAHPGSTIPAFAAESGETWMFADKVAVETFGCGGLLCGKIVWLRNPALRSPTMCNRTIVWGLRPVTVDRWTDGWFFDPENNTTYNLDATLNASGSMTARIYQGLTIFGRTEILTRIRSRSRSGWCSSGTIG